MGPRRRQMQSPCGAEGEEARLRRGLWCSLFAGNLLVARCDQYVLNWPRFARAGKPRQLAIRPPMGQALCIAYKHYYACQGEFHAKRNFLGGVAYWAIVLPPAMSNAVPSTVQPRGQAWGPDMLFSRTHPASRQYNRLPGHAGARHIPADLDEDRYGHLRIRNGERAVQRAVLPRAGRQDEQPGPEDHPDHARR